MANTARQGDHLVDASGMIESHAARERLLHAPVEYHRHISCLPLRQWEISNRSKTERVLVVEEEGREKWYDIRGQR